jgi:hypothetical protein
MVATGGQGSALRIALDVQPVMLPPEVRSREYTWSHRMAPVYGMLGGLYAGTNERNHE